MGLARFEDQRSIVYVKPRRVLASAGIEEFTVLFEGKSADGRTYTGEAYSFSGTCGQIAYPVSGTVSADNSTIVLEGKAPKRDGSCTQVGTRTEVLRIRRGARGLRPRQLASQRPLPYRAATRVDTLGGNADESRPPGGFRRLRACRRCGSRKRSTT